MPNRLLLLAGLATIVFASCQKEVTPKPAIANSTTTSENNNDATEAISSTLDTTNKWYGTYQGFFKTYPVIQDDALIANGVAQLPYLDRQFSYSYIYYDIPAKYNISGDSIALEARLKNPITSGFSDYDVILQIIGAQHTAEVHFVAEPAFSQYASYSVGNVSHTGINELIYYFGGFRTIKLAQKKYYTAVYINDVEVYKFRYGAQNSIGRVKTIGIGFKGYGICTSAGVKSSYSYQPIFSDNFNTDGQSNILYYF